MTHHLGQTLILAYHKSKLYPIDVHPSVVTWVAYDLSYVQKWKGGVIDWHSHARSRYGCLSIRLLPNPPHKSLSASQSEHKALIFHRYAWRVHSNPCICVKMAHCWSPINMAMWHSTRIKCVITCSCACWNKAPRGRKRDISDCCLINHNAKSRRCDISDCCLIMKTYIYTSYYLEVYLHFLHRKSNIFSTT